MALKGPQWENTYWYDDSDEERPLRFATSEARGRPGRGSALSEEDAETVKYDHPDHLTGAEVDALGHYKGLLDAKNAADGRAPAGPEAGWRATEEGLAQHNALRQGWTLPLDDPETGEQYDNTVPHSGDPLFPVGGNPVTAKSRKK